MSRSAMEVPLTTDVAGRATTSDRDATISDATGPTRVVARPWLDPFGSSSPWSTSDARTALSTTVVGVLILGWGWWEASGSADLNDQTGWLVVGILGSIIVLKGLFSWTRTGLTKVRSRRRDFIRRCERLDDLSGPAGDGTAGPSTLSDAEVLTRDRGFLTMPGSLRFHREDCLLVKDKDGKRLAQNSRSLKNLRPCEMCQPLADRSI